MNLRIISLPLVIILVSLAVHFGCESAPSTNEPISTFSYHITGALIQDPNIDSSRIVAKVTRSSRDYGDAGLVFGSNSLVFNDTLYGFDSVYTFGQTNSPGYATGVNNLILSDSPFFLDTAIITIPGAFNITTDNFDPPNHLLNGPGTVTYTWTGSNNAQGYVIAGVLADSAYRSYGYSLWVEVSFNSETLPIETFSQSPGSELDTGLYNIYVYAVTGIPDSALTSKLLPVPLPRQFPDNIAQGGFTGNFGTVQVTLLDTVRAALIP